MKVWAVMFCLAPGAKPEVMVFDNYVAAKECFHFVLSAFPLWIQINEGEIKHEYRMEDLYGKETD